MFRHPYLFVPLTIALVCSGLCHASAEECIDWPKAVAEGELARNVPGKTVVVQPMSDFTKREGDAWLVLGLRDYVADLLRSARELRVLSGATALYGTLTKPPDAVISGTFQHLDEKIRLFLRLSDGKSGVLKRQWELVFLYPQNKDFFAKIAAVVREILSELGAKADHKGQEAIENATASTEAYENYAKGRQLLETFNPAKALLAKPFFVTVKRLDYRSPLGYEGLMNLHAFLGLFHKQERQDFLGDYQLAQNELVQMTDLARAASPVFAANNAKPVKIRKPTPPALCNRYLEGHVAYLEGLAAAQAGEWTRASEAFARTVKAVPEDAMAWYQLSRIEAKKGDEARAREALQKAYAINPCIEKGMQ